jgi:hypothetical protein
MNATMPDEIKRGMHVLLVRHGREVHTLGFDHNKQIALLITISL